MSKDSLESSRLSEIDKELHSFLYIPESQRKDSASSGELEGLSLALKDNILAKDWPTTAASKILENFIAPYDATVVKRLLASGANLVGKTNLDEFAMGSSTENSAFGPTRNPWDFEKVPGGSSGGSASAVAANLCDASLGSDTGGSVRQPAAFCGVTGHKPTYGTVSRYGLIALASSLDQIGPLAKDAETVERVFKVIAGQDNNDQTTVPYTYEQANVSLKGLKIGLPKELWDLDIDKEVTSAAKEFVRFFEQSGANVYDVSLPYLSYGLPAYYVILPAEASSNLARYDGVRYQESRSGEDLMSRYLETRKLFGSEVKRRILLGTFALSVGHYDAYYQTAVRVKELIRQDYERVFRSVDVLIAPTTPSLPFKLGSRTQDPLKMYQSDLLTVSANLAGIPAASVPCGFSASGLPIGGQIIGPAFADNVILSLAKQFQEKTEYHKQAPRRFKNG